MQTDYRPDAGMEDRMNSVRREKLREFIENHQIVTLHQLTKLLPDVSLMTIHRDLNFLQQRGLVEKIRGGARYVATGPSEAAFSAREIMGRDAKAKIAEKAISLFNGATSVFIDAGTTMMAFARALPDIRLNITTTGPNIALELASRQNMTVGLCGGILNKSNLTLSGAAAIDMISGINIDLAFLVASGYSTSAGFTCGMESEASIKSLVISKARTVVLLLDATKLDRVMPYTFAQLDQLDYLITDLDPSEMPETITKVASGLIIL